jgi:hypothetical protein
LCHNRAGGLQKKNNAYRNSRGNWVGALTEQEELELLSLEKEKSFESTPGGAAVGNPNIAAQGGTAFPRFETRSLSDRLGTIGGAGGISATIGAFSPELLKAGGQAASAFPPTAGMGPALLTAGRLAEGHRAGLGGLGFIGGVTGETAGQALEAAGAPQPWPEIGRFAGGAVSPQMASGVVGLVKNVWTRMPSFTFGTKMQKELLKGIIDKLEGSPQTLTEQEKQYLDKMVTELRGGAKSDTPSFGLYDGMTKGATQARAESLKEANRVVSDAEVTVRSANANAESVQSAAEQALAGARMQRNAIGVDREAADIGQTLRDSVVTKQKAALKALRAQRDADQAAVDQIVGAKEASGQFVTSLPKYQTLVDSLKEELQPGVRSPDVQATFRHILNSVRPKTKSADLPFGGQFQDPFEPATPNITYQAIDDVRRELGKVFEGNPAEGYKGIDASIARKYYAMFSQIQKEFGGEAQVRLLENYAAGKKGMEMFASKKGKLAVALDAFDETQFATDASALPKKYFSSKEGIEALTELVGDKNAVIAAAKDYATNQLREASAKEVRTWLNSNTHMPMEVKFEVSKYLSSLERGEKVMELASNRLTTTQREGARTRVISQRRADQGITEAEGRASFLEGKGIARDRITELVEKGSPSDWQMVADATVNNPRARAEVNNAIRQVYASRAERSVKDVADHFAKTRPGMEMSGLLKAGDGDRIAKTLENIQAMRLPEQQKIGIAKKMVLQGIGAYAGTLGARAPATGYGLLGNLSELVPQ